MIRFVSGDMFEQEFDIRINTVNCVGVMGAGVALAFKERYPEMFREYRRECDAGRIQPGKLHVWKTLHGDHIVNFPTKRHWRNNSRYEDIQAGLMALREYLAPLGGVTVAVPALGCGHGGLDWERVRGMIERDLDDLQAEISVFEPRDSRRLGKKAREDTPIDRKALSKAGIAMLASVDQGFPHALRTQGIEALFARGDESISRLPRLAVLSSFKPTDREIDAATQCIQVLSREGLTISLNVPGRMARQLIDAAHSQGSNVIGWLAEGMQAHQVPAWMQGLLDERLLLLLSVASPNDRWNPRYAKEANVCSVALADAVLLTDPSPTWLSAFPIARELGASRRLFHVNYGKLPSDVAALLAKTHSTPISRTAARGAPNLGPVLAAIEQHAAHPARRANQEAATLTGPLDAAPHAGRARQESRMPTDSGFPKELGEGWIEPALAKPKKARKKAKVIAAEHLPPNLAQPVKVKVPDFSDPNRPKTCLEVDFPIVPINALSTLEGNAGKPIYQMSKWWARRRSCVFRAMLIAAAMEAPSRKHADGSVVLDENGIPEPDLDEAHKAVWDVYYANHQKAENFKHLKVLDCFMGGGTTIVEGSRLGFQMSGVDLNPVAWFVVKNELACTDPKEVERFFDQIEAEVKPQIQPFYVTEEPDGTPGKWFDVDSDKQVDVDPATLPPDERKKYRYEGPEVIYTFWAKHGPCIRPNCDHRTPIFTSPVIAEKKLGVKYMELTCKQCKTAFHAELGTARMAPDAERVILDSEHPFTELSQPFAKRLLDYSKGKAEEKYHRVVELCELVDNEPGLNCPNCDAFAGQWLRDVLGNHRSEGGKRSSAIDKKHLKILPARNSKKPVFSYLLVHPDWLKGAPGKIDGVELGGYADGTPDENAAWYAERLKNLRFIEVRGQIKLSEDTSAHSVEEAANKDQHAEADVDTEATDEDETEHPPADRKEYGLPHYITLADGTRIDTRHSTVPKQSHFTCGGCGQMQDVRYSVQDTKRLAPVAPYAIQCYSTQRDADSHPYSGRYFKAPTSEDIGRIVAAERDWCDRKDADLSGHWPRGEIPFSYMTHQANFALPKQGYTHWWKMFSPRQLLVHATLLHSICDESASEVLRYQALGAFQQYLRMQNMFVIWHQTYDKIAPFMSNPNYAPKARIVENNMFGRLGYGTWLSCCSTVVDGQDWHLAPQDSYLPSAESSGKSIKVEVGDGVLRDVDVRCSSASELPHAEDAAYDLVITDPPFGDNIFYSDLSNFFYAWLRLPLQKDYPDLFGHEKTPNAQEALAPRAMPEAEANAHYQSLLTACWIEAHRVMKDGGILAFTFHHSAPAQWAIVLESLFDAGFYLEVVYPINSDEMKGEGGSFGAKGTEYDMIHVCRKRLEEPQSVSWPKMRQWVKAELKRLRLLLESYKARDLSEADIRVILCGKALEFYSRHYGKVYTAEDAELSIRDALLGINQLLDEETGEPGERPPSILQPVCYQFLRLFGDKASLKRDEVGKNLRGTGMVQREFVDRGWVTEKNKVVYRVPIKEQFEKTRQRPRKEMKTEIDQAHFLIGAALPGSGLNIEDELSKNTWVVRRSVEAVLQWYAKTAVEPEIKDAATLAATLLRKALETRRAELVDEQGFLFDDLDEVA